MPISEEALYARLTDGEKFVEKGLAARDRNHTRQFLDGSREGASQIQADDLYGTGELPDGQEVGSINYLATNVQVKVSSIAIGDPDFHIECDEPQIGDPGIMGGPAPTSNSDISRKFYKDLWKKRHWARLTQKPLQKRSISGMGCAVVFWDKTRGPVIEHVKASDLIVDPLVVDWTNLEWGARKIKMSREKALKAYPVLKEILGGMAADPSKSTLLSATKTTIPLKIYWDTNEEIVCFEENVLKRSPNLYTGIYQNGVPLKFLEGDIAPESEFSLGDYDQAQGQQEMLAGLTAIINDQAENGGAIGWYNPAFVKNKEAFAQGKPHEFLEVDTTPESCFGYVNGSPMNPAVLEALRIAQQGLDSVTGVSEYQRGVLNQSVKFATEAALLANQSGSRGTKARKEFELFCEEIAQAVHQLILKFGASMIDMTDEKDVLLYEALQSVQCIDIIESSTAYEDPAYEMTKAVQMMQVLAPFLQLGVLDPVKLALFVLQAFGQKNPQQFLMQAPMQPQAAPAPLSPQGIPAPGPEAPPQGAPQQDGAPAAVPIPNYAGIAN